MPSLTSELVCFGCGARVSAEEPHPFRCPRDPAPARSDGIDHVLRRHRIGSEEEWRRLARSAFDSSEANPFLRYRGLLHPVHRARAIGLTDAEVTALVEELDDAIAEVDGHGFSVTPFAPAPALATAIGLEPDLLFVKDETGNVSGSHKARHLMGVMVWLEARRRSAATGRSEARPRLAIASCGNAALAAAVVAKAAGYPLDVYVPPEASPAVIERLLALGARLVSCPRRAGETGDPCYLRFREAVLGEALPFTCQGPENGLVIDGGQTLIWEVVSELRRRGRSLGRLFVQVGGGALASACIHGLHAAHDLGLLPRLPAVFAIQTERCAPLRRAWRRLAEEIASRHTDLAGSEIRAAADAGLARAIAVGVAASDLEADLHRAARQRFRYMWPWETAPRSVATGILDDETYDWLAVVEGMLRTGGHPLVVDEATLVEANRLASEHTTIRADATGTAGLAGLLALDARRAGGDRSEAQAVLFTGAVRESADEQAGVQAS